jgi:ethanolamine-phosphate phospho-lyase
MKDILLKYYGIEADEIIALKGYDNANYLIKSARNKFIFKTYKLNEEMLDFIRAESQILSILNEEKPGHYPSPVETLTCKDFACVKIAGEETIIRLLTFLEGTFYCDSDQDAGLRESFGKFLAEMNTQFLPIKNYIVQARKYPWNIENTLLNEDFIADISDPRDRKIIAYFMMQFRENVLSVLPKLRKSIIHGDANDQNVLTKKGKVYAIIDFGDMVYSAIINEVAVAISYAVMRKKNPVACACDIIRGYHGELKLLPRELDVLYYLIAARLCISVCQSAHSKKADPGNSYITVSEKPAWELLYQWLKINPIYAKNEFHKAAGFSPEKKSPVKDMIANRQKYINPIVSLSYKKPVYFDRAVFQYMYDAYGNTFLDAYNNIPHVGHSHPRVTEAGQRQMAKLNTNTRYIYDLLSNYAERLTAKFPKQLNKVFFVNSGSAASDLAIRLARHYTGYNDIMVTEHGYHGHTQTGIEISDYKFNNKKGPGQKPHILKTPIPDIFWGKYTDNNAGKKFAKDAIEILNEHQQPVAAFISEPIVGCGGQVPLAKGYLENLYPSIRRQGGVCISDEVQTGFGRLGQVFWGFEDHHVIPDIVILGKPMGNGHPMGAVVTTDEIAYSFSKGVEFFSSFGGNPVSCAIGLSVLDVLEEEGLQQNALKVGEHYKELMNRLKGEYQCISDVRGSGLFLGFEITDNLGRQDTKLAAQIKNKLRERNILISTDGPYDNVLKSKPPLCFSMADAEEVVENIHLILRDISI